MKICVPTQDDRGLDSEAYDHVGAAPYYTIVDTGAGTVEAIPRGSHGHGSGECGPAVHIRGQGVDAIVCNNIGRKALDTLEAAGITVVAATGRTVRAILNEARANLLRPITSDAICRGHGGRHGRCEGHGPGGRPGAGGVA